ncbi:UDP-galactose transporter (LPG5B) [Leptomonas pyrrhocoris]|uniref:UDP-galactose transporter (LPG5B) n=1 Tax=Leptomonas pyrrhocoris TaxID=157538 RepID=A0A0M9FY56_LEPPY|nr:UDP-galactose transporter (LPG5B) [Leptomonas pyrrhocoris]KPA78495.1 UDP-galactose transporter (LPG5B) [Leptomonas pyrrhocoris]|eukprot:XP_015656934.1 UDP-galactose transporter (LPG5B) [Leptomonas pyrrhocoris]
MTVLQHVCSMAMVSLVVLVIQNSLLVIMTRFSRKNVDAAVNYHTSTLVLNQECAKMLMCLIIYAFDDVRKQFERESASSSSPPPPSLGINGTIAVVEEVSGDAPSKQAASSLAKLKSTGAKALSSPNDDDSDTPPFKDDEATEVTVATVMRGADSRPVAVTFGEEEGGTTTAGPSTTVRRGMRGTVVSTSPAGSSRPTDPAVNRRSRLRFVWARTQTAVHLYGSMLSTAVLRRDTLKLFVPAFLFNFQNFLIFVGLSNLDAVSFQVWSQTKLLSTALFSVWLLHRKLSLMQWISLVVLTAGVLGAQLGAPKGGSPSAAAYTVPTSSTPTPTPRQLLGAQRRFTRMVWALGAAEGQTTMDGDEEPQANALIGIAACVLSGLSSSYAGVYFEKVVKTTSPTLSIRNVQLSIFGIPLAFVSMLLLDVIPRWYAQHQCGDAIHWNIFRDPFPAAASLQHFRDDRECPARPFYFWQRYDQLLTWGLVAIHAFGGLLVAIVVKYADNILKGFATGVAVIVSGMMSSAIWGYKPTMTFVFGAVLVIGSSIMFHKFEPKR